jgi:hypothetical protein
MLFRNLYGGVASELIRFALEKTYVEWEKRYGSLPSERLRTEIGVREVKSREPGRCYVLAGWEKGPIKRGKLFLFAPTKHEP